MNINFPNTITAHTTYLTGAEITPESNLDVTTVKNPSEPPKITPEVYLSVEKMFARLKNSESWRGKISNQNGFSKEDKEGLNLIAFAMLSKLMLKPDQDISPILAYALRRLYVKAYTWDSKPNNKNFFRNNIEGYDAQLASYVVNDVIAKDAETEEGKEIMNEFAKFIHEEAAKLSPEVEKVYKAARVLTTAIEYEEVKNFLRPDEIEETRQNVLVDIEKYVDLPYFYDIANGIGKYGKLKDLLTTISWSRYTIRWQGYIFHTRCSILSHMLESAIISYLMNMELGRESDWLKDFWVLLFHDIAEIWTDDIPSPAKDGIFFDNISDELKQELGKSRASLREIAELQELKALKEKFYPELPESIKNFFKNGVMLEDVTSPEEKRFYKGADYFSADLEVWWNIRSGCRDKCFKDILERSLRLSMSKDKYGYRTPAQQEVLKFFVEKTDAITFI